jgi:hypothetical protein
MGPLALQGRLAGGRCEGCVQTQGADGLVHSGARGAADEPQAALARGWQLRGDERQEVWRERQQQGRVVGAAVGGPLEAWADGRAAERGRGAAGSWLGLRRRAAGGQRQRAAAVARHLMPMGCAECLSDAVRCWTGGQVVGGSELRPCCPLGHSQQIRTRHSPTHTHSKEPQDAAHAQLLALPTPLFEGAPPQVAAPPSAQTATAAQPAMNAFTETKDPCLFYTLFRSETSPTPATQMLCQRRCGGPARLLRSWPTGCGEAAHCALAERLSCAMHCTCQAGLLSGQHWKGGLLRVCKALPSARLFSHRCWSPFANRWRRATACAPACGLLRA